ncbi:hypothetical protein QQ008_28760 [Fulvivirgaceae bacterium BMA10]|uniref:O-antigen ligase family protein n=1 Tax=Splendidivirga corallicola TaxID=3051826 RepID=A0ABT8KX78_9BACT|nr:hypothetical protein [Fulvivirgaceae bacterium BMA10]
MTLDKKYAFLFLVGVPYLAGLIPETKVGPLTIHGERLFMLIFAALFFLKLINKRFVIKISKVTIWLLAFNLYSFLNRVVQDTLKLPEVIEYSLPILFLLYIDNLEFEKKDHQAFTKMLTIVAIGTFIASAIQLFIDPFFYSGGTPEAIEHIKHYKVADGIYRNNSLYRGIGANEGAIAMGYLSVYFLFLNFHEYKKKYLILTGILFFSVFVIFAKYCWLMFLIGLFYFLFFKYPKSRITLFILGFCLLFVIYFIVGDMLVQSSVYQNRVAADTYVGRTESTGIFFERFFMRKPIFGFGVSSWEFPEYLKLYYIGIHVGHFDILFKGGTIGIILLFGFLYQIYRKGSIIKRKTGNPIFHVFVINYIIINATAVFIPISYYGYHFMLFYLVLYYKIYIVQDEKPD